MYENSQWKLTVDGSTWFFEAKRPSKYWVYVRDVIINDHMFDHVAEKTWCSLPQWIDACRKAVELSPYKLGYDLDTQISKAEIWKSRHHKHGSVSGSSLSEAAKLCIEG